MSNCRQNVFMRYELIRNIISFPQTDKWSAPGKPWILWTRVSGPSWSPPATADEAVEAFRSVPGWFITVGTSIAHTATDLGQTLRQIYTRHSFSMELTSTPAASVRVCVFVFVHVCVCTCCNYSFLFTTQTQTQAHVQTLSTQSIYSGSLTERTTGKA